MIYFIWKCPLDSCRCTSEAVQYQRFSLVTMVITSACCHVCSLRIVTDRVEREVEPNKMPPLPLFSDHPPPILRSVMQVDCRKLADVLYPCLSLPEIYNLPYLLPSRKKCVLVPCFSIKVTFK